MKPASATASVNELAGGRFDAVLDARTPAEYAEDHIPGAISAPVLDDAQRAQVGTLYKQVSSFEAKKLGAALVAKNVALHIETHFREMPKDWKPLVYCWRGGKRSGALAHVLREIGWDATTLDGGYRSYRRWVVDQLEEKPSLLEFRVVHGPTGSGKSRLLAALKALGAQVLDLEGLAAHRGSVLGNLPGQPQPSQKMFESLLLKELSAFDPAQAVFVEGESRKIGQLQVPEALIERMRSAECVLLETGLETRVALLLEEYRHFLDGGGALETQLDCLVALHGREKIAGWKALAARRAWSELVSRLLVEHYDPAYSKSSARNFSRLSEARTVRVEACAAAAFETAAQGVLQQMPETLAA